MRVRGVGYWELFVPHARAGDRYKFDITGSDGRHLPLKSDPVAFAAGQFTREAIAVVKNRQFIEFCERAGDGADRATTVVAHDAERLRHQLEHRPVRRVADAGADIRQADRPTTMRRPKPARDHDRRQGQRRLPQRTEHPIEQDELSQRDRRREGWPGAGSERLRLRRRRDLHLPRVRRSHRGRLRSAAEWPATACRRPRRSPRWAPYQAPHGWPSPCCRSG